jgi:hypothetical protein
MKKADVVQGVRFLLASLGFPGESGAALNAGRRLATVP